jgi:thiamine biosynthesis protein ThiS
MKSLTINGTQRQYAPEAMPRTLSDLLTELDVAAATVVAEIDGAIVPAEQFGATQLKHGQTIELVKFMGGG